MEAQWCATYNLLQEKAVAQLLGVLSALASNCCQPLQGLPQDSPLQMTDWGGSEEGFIKPLYFWLWWVSLAPELTVGPAKVILRPTSQLAWLLLLSNSSLFSLLQGLTEERSQTSNNTVSSISVYLLENPGCNTFDQFSVTDRFIFQRYYFRCYTSIVKSTNLFGLTNQL